MYFKIGLKSTKKYNMKEKVIRGEFPELANVLLTITFLMICEHAYIFYT